MTADSDNSLQGPEVPSNLKAHFMSMDEMIPCVGASGDWESKFDRMMSY